MANENSIDVYHALMALEEKVTGVAPDPENVTTDVALALADIFRTDAPMAQETAIVNAIDTITANYGGGGGAATTDVYLWNMIGNVVPSKVEYISGYSGENPTYTELETEGITNEFNGNTIYGLKVKDCPAGGYLIFTLPSGYDFDAEGYPKIGYSAVLFTPIPGISRAAMIPIDGMYQIAPFVTKTVG